MNKKKDYLIEAYTSRLTLLCDLDDSTRPDGLDLDAERQKTWTDLLRFIDPAEKKVGLSYSGLPAA